MIQSFLTHQGYNNVLLVRTEMSQSPSRCISTVTGKILLPADIASKVKRCKISLLNNATVLAIRLQRDCCRTHSDAPFARDLRLLPELLTGPVVGKYSILCLRSTGQNDFLAPHNWCYNLYRGGSLQRTFSYTIWQQGTLVCTA